jgi:hypothetical protein
LAREEELVSETDPYADVDPAVFAPDAEQASSFPSADELPESDPDMWNPAPGEVPGTGGMLFPDAPDVQAPPSAPAPGPSADSVQGPPEGWEVIDADGKGTGHDAYGNPVAPTPFEPAPQSEPPEGWEVIDADGKGTGHDAYGNPVSRP